MNCGEPEGVKMTCDAFGGTKLLCEPAGIHGFVMGVKPEPAATYFSEEPGGWKGFGVGRSGVGVMLLCITAFVGSGAGVMSWIISRLRWARAKF